MRSSSWTGFTNIIVTGSTAAFLLHTRSIGVAYFALGAVSCSLTVKILKRLIRQGRPDPIVRKEKKKSYGMPSTHSATITYFGTYIPLACAFLPIHPSLSYSTFTRLWPPLVVVPCAILIAVSRVWLGHHTWPQVIVGCSYGAAWAFLWFRIWTHGMSDFGQLVEQEALRYLAS
ncbi:phosphatidic acid phosphatase type 2/haloperoxidase [Amylostereum chailletii]|nr:phosphatidic acid phosphatase type 2/haloperoxidase [Amylostereum chailletii]